MQATIHSIEVIALTPTEVAAAIARDLIGYEVVISYGTSEQEEVRFVGSRSGKPGDVYLTVYPGKQARRPSYGAQFDDSEETQIQVEQPERFGVRFNQDWIRQFFAEEVTE